MGIDRASAAASCVRKRRIGGKQAKRIALISRGSDEVRHDLRTGL